ncbi:MAG: hypothetical protein IKL89_00480 [Clostridia bacterium]|nr:hypothetical protein [Clostridia bacterium]
MNRSGLKNVILILLLLVNLAAAGVLCYRAISESRAAAELAGAAADYLSLCGVSVEDGVLSGRVERFEVVRLAPDVVRETEIARALLGPEATRSENSSHSEFSSEAGLCSFDSDGYIEVLLHNSGISAASPAAARRAVTRLLGEALDISGAEISSEAAEGGFTVTFRDQLAGVYVENASLRARLTPEGTLSVQGRWRMGTPSANLTSGDLIQAAAVAKFVGSCAGDLPFRELEEISPVYWLYPEASGELSIIPAWRLETDGKPVILDAISAERLQ